MELSTAQIGLRIGVSKNAVIGKARRIGLEPRASPLARKPKTKKRQHVAEPLIRLQSLVKKTMRPAKVARVTLAKRMAIPTPQEKRESVVAAPMPASPKSLLELGTRDCHWPVARQGGQHLFCGTATDTGRYCAHHVEQSQQRRRE